MTVTVGEVISAREAQLVAMLARGYTTDHAARELKLSRHTVGEVISVLLERFDCSNRAALVAYCYVHRLLPLGVWPPPCPCPSNEPGHPHSTTDFDQADTAPDVSGRPA
jgi:DNA-binding CsgD family transcriptional regulator